MKEYLKYIDKNSERFHRYRRNIKLYEGDHYDVFDINQFEYYSDAKNQYLVYNYAEIVTNVFNNLMWSEDPIISFSNPKNQEYIEDFIAKNGVMLKLRRATSISSSAGEAVLQVAIDQVSPDVFGPVLNIVDNSIWYPIYDKNNPSKDASGQILYIEKEINKQNSSQKAVLLEVHTAGQIEYLAFVVEGEDVKAVSPMDYFAEVMNSVLVDNAELIKSGKFIIKTNCDYPLIFQLPNYKKANHYFGVSDYTTPVISKIFAINQNLNQMQFVLKKHAHPKMIVPDKVIKQAIAQVTSSDTQAKNLSFESANEATRLYKGDKSLFETMVAQKLIDKLEFYGSDINSSDPKYLTWDGNLKESREQNNELKQMLLEETQVAKVLFNTEGGIGNASGVAILRLAQPSLHKATMKQAYVRDVLTKVLYSILQLSIGAQIAGYEGLTPEMPTIKFRDGLVNDLKETIDNQVLMLDAGITTKTDAVMATLGLSQVDAEQKVNDIQASNNLFGGDIISTE